MNEPSLCCSNSIEKHRKARFSLAVDEVTAVLPVDFVGRDDPLLRVMMPLDIRGMCDAVLETPRFTGRNQLSADDEQSGAQ